MRRTVTLSLLPALWLAAPGKAEARSTSWGLQSGTEIVKVGSVKPGLEKDASYPGVGFRYQHLTLGGVDFWTWDGEFCTYDRVAGTLFYDPVTLQEAARLTGRSERRTETPLGYRFPAGLCGTIAVLLVWMWRKWKLMLREERAGRSRHGAAAGERGRSSRPRAGYPHAART